MECIWKKKDSIIYCIMQNDIHVFKHLNGFLIVLLLEEFIDLGHL